MNKKNVLHAPYKYLSLYIVVTLLIAFFGPVSYSFTAEMVILVVIYIGVFLASSYVVMRNASIKPIVYYETSVQLSNQRMWSRIVKISIILDLMLKTLLLISMINREGLNYDLFTTDFYSLIAKSYTTTKTAIRFNDTNVFRQVNTLLTFIHYIAICGGLYLWKNLKPRYKIAYILTYVVNAVYTVFYISTLRSIFDLFFYPFFFFIITSQKALYVGDRAKRKPRNKRKLLIIIFTVIIILFIVNTLFTRANYWGVDFTRRGYNHSSIFLWLVPDPLKDGVSILYSYLSQGFYGLALCLTLPFEWTFGFGSAIGLTSILNSVFPGLTDAIYPRLYILRAERAYGYDGWSHWHTAFSWLANDFTFVGALIYMAGFAYVFMRCYKSVMEGRNVISYILLNLLTIQYIFLVANNQLLQDRGSSLGLLVVFVLWLIFEKKANNRTDSQGITAAK